MVIASILCTLQLAVGPNADTLRPSHPAVQEFVRMDLAATTDSAQQKERTWDSLSTAAHDTLALQPADTAIVAGNRMGIDPLPGPLDMITNLPGDWYNWGRNTFSVHNLPLIGGMTALTAGLVMTDYESWQPFKKIYESSTVARDVSDAFVFVGDGNFQFGLAGLFATYGFLMGDTTALRTASQTFEVIIACGAVVQVLKHLTGRESPFVATTPTGRWVLFPNQIEYHKHVPHYDAFPSGHIATALATLVVIMENYPDEDWIGWIGYPAVGLVGLGLVATSIHWWSDIPLGLALGYSFGMLVSEHNNPRKQTTGGPQLGISVHPSGTPGLALSWRW